MGWLCQLGKAIFLLLKPKLKNLFLINQKTITYYTNQPEKRESTLAKKVLI